MTALSAEKAQTAKVMFSNVADRPNIYKTVPHTHYNTKSGILHFSLIFRNLIFSCFPNSDPLSYMKLTYFWGFIRGFLVWPTFLLLSLLGLLNFFGVVPIPETLWVESHNIDTFPKLKKNPRSYIKQTDHAFILAFFLPSFAFLLASFLTFFGPFLASFPLLKHSG